MPSKKKTTKSNRTIPSWKTVELEDGHIAKGIPRDMIGIEELTDYRLVQTNSKTGKAQVKIVKSKSPKAVSKDSNVDCKTEAPESKSDDKPKAIQKAKQKSKLKASDKKASHAETVVSETVEKSKENGDSKANKGDAQDKNEVSQTSDDKSKITKKSEKKLKRKASEAKAQDGTEVDTTKQPAESDCKPKATKKAKKNGESKAAEGDAQDKNEVSQTSGKPKITKKSKKKLKKAKAKALDDTEVDTTKQPAESDSKPKATKKAKKNGESKAAEGDAQDKNEVSKTSGKPKITKKSKKKLKKAKAKAQDGTEVDTTKLPTESDSKPKATKKAKKTLKRKASAVDGKSGTDSATESSKSLLNGDDTETIVEPAAKRSKEDEEEEEEEEEKTEDIAPAMDDFEITPDMIIWKAMFLPDCLVRAVWEKGFLNPTAIQLAVLPTAMKGRKDVVGAAETGSGKTLAFGIPILSGILKDKAFEKRKAENADISDEDQNSDEEEKKDDEGTEEAPQEEPTEKESGDEEEVNEGIGCVRVIDNIDFGLPRTQASRKKLRALIITPTRELAVQIEKHLKAVAKYTDISMCLVIGGMAAPKQERILNKGPDIVIGTPGRLWELIEGGNSHLGQVTDLRYLALDETDRLLEKGHFSELRSLLEHINKDESKKRYRQNFVFSATLTLAHDLPNRLGPKKNKKGKDLKLNNLLSLVDIRPKAKIVDLTATKMKPASLSEMKLFSATLEDKDFYLYYFLRHHPGRTLVFCNSINNVRRLTSVFTLLEMNPFPLHAQMHQKQRLKHLEKFSSQDNSLLIATDVAARGLDIPNVVNVVHFQIPRTSENYVHRSGRTARASRNGLSLMLIEPGEAGLYRQLCHTLKKDKKDLPDYDVDMKTLSAVKQRVNLARSIETLEHRTKRERSDENWVKKMAEEADLLVDDNGYDSDNDPTHELAKITNELKNKRKELSQLLARPLKRSAAT